MIRQQRPAELERRAGNREHLQRLARVEVPHDDRRAELLHGLAVLQELPDRPHVVLPARERRREHAVEVDVDPHVVAVDRLRGHPDRPDELAVVAVLGQPGPAAAVLGVGQGRDQHPPRQRVERVGAHQAAGVLHEGLDRLHQLRLGRVRGHVEDEDLAGVEAARPEEPPVIGEAGVVRLVLAGHRGPVDDLAVAAGGRVDVHGDDAVVAVRHPLHPEGPDVDVVFLARHLGQEGGLAGLVGQGRRGGRHRQGHREGHTPQPASRSVACAS